MKKILAIALCLLLTGCGQAGRVQDAIQDNLTQKTKALAEGDIDLYTATLTRTDTYYRNEQRRWFSEMRAPGMEDLSFEIEDVTLRDDITAVALIRQRHHFGEDVEIGYPLLYRLEDGQWLDCGIDFQEIPTERYTLKYMDGETHTEDFLDIIDTAYDNLETVFTEKPDPDFAVKLYHDQELLRQRTIPSMGWLFTGWGEADESLKLYTGQTPLSGYLGTVQHELIHHITMGICQNNLPGWLADGIALHYGNFALAGGDALSLGYAEKENVALSLADLEDTDLWEADEQSETVDWYCASELYVKYMIDTYGHDSFMQLFYKAGKKPYNENILNPDFAAQNNETMAEVLDTVWNITKEELSADYLAWLDAQ